MDERNNTMWRLSPLVAALVVTAVLAVGEPAASASTASPNQFSIPTAVPGFQGWPVGASSVAGNAAAGACGSATGGEVMGRTGTTAQVCGGLSFIGPAMGQVATVIGPTIISPAVVGSSIVNGNNIVLGP